MYTRTELTPKNRSLPHPYPIALSPVVSNFGFYCFRDDGGFCFHNFHARYAAHKFISLLTDGRAYKWLDDRTILLDNGTRIRGEREDDLENAIDYEPTKDEASWEPSEPENTYIRCFLGQSRIRIDRDPDTQEIVRIQDNPSDPQQKPYRVSSRKPMPEQEKVARRKTKVKTGQYITISQICADLGHKPSVCRAALRKLKVPKPDHGWAWPPSEAEDIKKRLSKLVK